MRGVAWLYALWLISKRLVWLNTHRGPWSIQDFDALGDGERDNTRSIQRAMDIARHHGSNEVRVPPGLYRVRGQVDAWKPLTLGSYSGLVGGNYVARSDYAVKVPSASNNVMFEDCTFLRPSHSEAL